MKIRSICTSTHSGWPRVAKSCFATASRHQGGPCAVWTRLEGLVVEIFLRGLVEIRPRARVHVRADWCGCCWFGRHLAGMLTLPALLALLDVDAERGRAELSAAEMTKRQRRWAATTRRRAAHEQNRRPRRIRCRSISAVHVHEYNI